MDDTLFDYTSAFQEEISKNPDKKFPQSNYGFFLNLKPIDGAIEAYHTLKQRGHRVLFLSAPSVLNPLCYTEKRLSIEKHFGLDACYDLIIMHDKSLAGKGDVLIDDRVDSNKQNEFEGMLIHFNKETNNWKQVIKTVDSLSGFKSELKVIGKYCWRKLNEDRQPKHCLIDLQHNDMDIPEDVVYENFCHEVCRSDCMYYSVDKETVEKDLAVYFRKKIELDPINTSYNIGTFQ